MSLGVTGTDGATASRRPWAIVGIVDDPDVLLPVVPLLIRFEPLLGRGNESLCLRVLRRRSLPQVCSGLWLGSTLSGARALPSVTTTGTQSSPACHPRNCSVAAVPDARERGESEAPSLGELNAFVDLLS